MKNAAHVSRTKKIIPLLTGLVFVALIILWLNRDKIKNTGLKKSFCSPGANLILISFDTLRADRLGCYGNKRSTSPAIDSLADRGVRFEKVIAESSWTLPSHMTIMTGLYPETHGVNLEINRLPDKIQTIAQILKENEYQSNAVTCGALVHPAYGFGRGFENYDHEMKTFKDTVEISKQWIEGLSSDKPYFLFLHTYDVHCPYHPPEKYSKMFETRPPEDHIDTKGKCGNPDYNNAELTLGQLKFLADQYDAGIRWADDSLNNFLKFLEKRDAFKNTVIVFLSDHGEEFMEHGQIGHERTLYIESLKVPLIIVAPGLQHNVVKELTGLANVVPTVLEILDVETPPMDGVSMVPFMTGTAENQAQKPVFSELRRHVSLRSLVYGSDHLIFNINTKQKQYFDLSADPREQKNLMGQDLKRAEELDKMLVTHYDDIIRHEDFLDEGKLDRQTEILRGLGYIE